MEYSEFVKEINSWGQYSDGQFYALEFEDEIVVGYEMETYAPLDILIMRKNDDWPIVELQQNIHEGNWHIVGDVLELVFDFFVTENKNRIEEKKRCWEEMQSLDDDLFEA